MAYNTAIGNVQTIYLESYDSLSTKYETNISKGFTINPAATFAAVNTAARALNALTSNVYEDTTLVTNVSVNDEMTGEEVAVTPTTATITVSDNDSDAANPITQTFTISGANEIQAVNIIDNLSGVENIRFLNTSINNTNKTFTISAFSIGFVSSGSTATGEIKVTADNVTLTIPLTITRVK